VEPDKNRVFIVYGRNKNAHSAMVQFLHSLKLNPLDFDEVRNDLGGTPFVGKIVHEGLRRAQAIIVLFTPDEYVSLHPGLYRNDDEEGEKHRWQARPNVILEAGMALGIDEQRTILVIIGDVHLSSDLHGRHFLYLDNSSDARSKLRDALVGAGCEVGKYVANLNNPSISGDFESCLKPPALPEVSAHSPFLKTRRTSLYTW